MNKHIPPPLRTRRQCTVEGCIAPVHGHGWCAKHYLRMRTTGSLADPAPRPSVEQRFWQKVDKLSSAHGCWLWTGGTYTQGYGVFGPRPGTGVRAHRFAYTLMHGPVARGLEVAHNCPGGDNKLCVNPAHMLLLTSVEHGRDRAAKRQMPSGDAHPARIYPERWSRGEQHYTHTHPELVVRGDRHGSRTHPEKVLRGDAHPARIHPERMARGERNGSARLTTEQVISIRERYSSGAANMSQLAAEVGLSDGAIWFIVHRRTWKHI